MADSSRGEEEETQEYVARTYRDYSAKGRLVAFSATWKETDLYLKATRDLSEEAMEAILRCRTELDNYIGNHPDFASSLLPLPLDPEAPTIIQEMLQAAVAADVGPMAAVAGAVSEYVGQTLAAYSEEIIVENGGDLYIATQGTTTVGIFAGKSPLSGRLGLRIPAEDTPCGVCTSSGTVGPSLSRGQADAVTVWAASTALADAVATALGNRVTAPYDIEPTLKLAEDIPGLKGVVVILGDRIGLWGAMDIVGLDN